MIDWHSHILPAMDDGSKDPDESIAMLEALAAQGVDTVIATPHFNANDESVDAFLQRREASLALLGENARREDIRVLCGAEVKYYPGISRMEGLERLAVTGTNRLLLEMPFVGWSEHTVKELLELANTRGLRIVLAHVERYPALQNGRVYEELISNGIHMQVNASFFERWLTRGKAMRLLATGYIHYVGSDCHNMTTRPPSLSGAYALIQKKLGDEFVEQMNKFGYRAIKRKITSMNP